jgi:hypothetical protein
MALRDWLRAWGTPRLSPRVMRMDWHGERLVMMRWCEAVVREHAAAAAAAAACDVCEMRLTEWVRWLARSEPGRCGRWDGALAVESGLARPGRSV